MAAKIKINWKLKVAITELYGTQADFARAIGVSEAIVSRVVHYRVKVPTDRLPGWAQALDVFTKELEDILNEQTS